MAYIPTDDTFDYGTGGSDPYGSYLLGYLGWVPKSGVDPGYMVRSAQVGAGRAFFVGSTAVASNGLVPVAVARRQSFPEDVSVRGHFKFQAVAGVSTVDHGSELGVFARATGGTLTADTTQLVRYVDGQAYAALFKRTGTDTYDLEIVRWSGGTETVLSTTSYTVVAPTLSSRAMLLRLDVETNTSGDVELSVWVRNFKATTVSPSRPPRGMPFVGPPVLAQVYDVTDTWTELDSHTDSSGSKITGGGRCGLVVEREREYDSGATRIVTTVANFAVYAIGGGVLWSDPMIRAEATLADTVASAWGATTRLLSSDWTNDLFSGEQDYSQILRRNTSTERVRQTNTADLGNAVNLTPATSDYIELDLSDPKYVTAIQPRSKTEFSFSVWTNLDANAAGNVLFDDFLDIGNGTSIGLTLGLKPGVGANTYRAYATVSSESSGSGATYETADIADSGVLGTTEHFAFTVSAINDRVRFYVGGSLSVERAMTENPELRGSATTRVGWNGTAGATTANYLDGRVDELRIYWVELTANEVSHLAASSGVGPSIDRARLVHGWGLEAAEFTAGGFGFDGTYLRDVHGVTLPTSLQATLMGSASTTTGIANAARPRVLAATQRPVTSTTLQNRAVAVEFADVNQTAGVFVRAGFTSEADFTGYRLDARPDPGGIVRLWRVRDGEETLLASVSATIALATEYELRLQVSDAPTSSGDSAAMLAAWLDGTQLVLSIETGQNLTVDSLGTVRDSSTSKIASGALEGFHVHTPGGTAAIEVDDWSQGFLDTLKFLLTGPSVPIRSEVLGVTGSLNTLIGSAELIGSQRVETADLFAERYESGHMVRHLEDVSARRGFRLRFQVDDATLTAFEVFWDEHQTEDQVVPFLFTPFEETQGVFFFPRSEFTATPVSPSEHVIQFEILELVDPSPVPPALATPNDVAPPLFWGSAQSNVYAAVPNLPPDGASVKTLATLNGDVHRVGAADVGLPPGPSTFNMKRHMNGLFSSGSASGQQWTVVEFASTAVINGKRTLEPRIQDEFYIANGNLSPYDQPWWSDGSGFTFMAHIVPPTSGYGASEHILRVAAAGDVEMLRLGWTTSQFYRTAGSVFANFGPTGYDLGSSTTAKTILCRWTPGGQVKIWDGGGAAVASTTGFAGLSMTSVKPSANRLFVTSSGESSAIQTDAGIGTKLFVQEVAIWPVALTDAEVDAVASYWAALYGSTWTPLVP